jgi:hypothetical protein
MSGKARIGSLVLAAALAVLGAWFAFGQANQDPCGGKYAGEGLKATFLPEYWDFELIIPPPPQVPQNPNTVLWSSNITNGNASCYQYIVPGGDCVFRYRNGHVIVGVGWPLEWNINHDRYVNLRFRRQGDGNCPKPGENGYCPLPPFMGGAELVHTSAIQFWTGNGFQESRGYKGDQTHPADPNILFLTATNALLDFGALTPGQTYYFQMTLKFKIAGYNEEFRSDSQYKVYYGPFNDGSGGFGWEITPIHEAYYIQLVTKVGKKLVPNGPPTYHESSVYHEELGSSTVAQSCCLGQFNFPFKLRLQRLQ